MGLENGLDESTVGVESSENAVERVASISKTAPFYREDFFSEAPEPFVGIEYTLVNPGTEYFGISSETGMPCDTILPKINTPYFVTLDEYTPFVAEVSVFKENRELFEKVETVRRLLEENNAAGHSITTFIGEANDISRNVYNILRFGLWPEMNTATHERLPEPWTGDFKKSGMGFTAGDHFNGFAVIPLKSSKEYVQIPEEVGGGSFVPPLELTYVVPTEEIKQSLVNLAYKDPFTNIRIEDRRNQLKERIYTFDDIIKRAEDKKVLFE